MAYILHKVLSHLFVLFLRASNTDCIMSGTDNRVKTYRLTKQGAKVQLPAEIVLPIKLHTYFNTLKSL